MIDQVMQLDDPNIVKLIDVDFSGQIPWLMYEFVSGGELGTHVASLTNPTERVEFAMSAITELAKTVGRCHRMGSPIVHRDLKPSNILVSRDSSGKMRLKITDFGIGDVMMRQALNEVKQLTKVIASVSTPSLIRSAHTPLYASPQQIDGLPGEPRDDVHSLGVMFWQLLHGRFDRKVPAGIAWKRQLRELGIGAGLIELIERCIDEEPDSRPADGLAMADEMSGASRESVSVATETPKQQTQPSMAEQFESSIQDATTKNQHAVKLAEQGDFATAVGVLESIRIGEMRDTRLLRTATTNRDRLIELDRELGAKALAQPLEGLRLVEEFLRLKPNDADKLRVLEVLTKVCADRFQVGKPFTSSTKMEFAWIAPGTFMMGAPDADGEASTNEKPQHEVVLTRGFHLGRFPVTRGQYEVFVRATGHARDQWRNPGFAQTESHPVVNVPWEDAVAFCRWMSKTEGREFRLATEAEWEYACRAGTISTRYNERIANCADGIAWFDSNSGYATHAVGKLSPNGWGLFDMLGNVWEWCADYWSDKYDVTKCIDPQGPPTGTYRVDRGGSWRNSVGSCRSTKRGADAPVSTMNNLGFRVVRSLV